MYMRVPTMSYKSYIYIVDIDAYIIIRTYTALSLSRSGVTVRSRPVYIALLRPLKTCQQKQGGKLPKPALGDRSPWYHVEGPPRDGQHWFTRWSWQEAIAACQGWANLG